MVNPLPPRQQALYDQLEEASLDFSDALETLRIYALDGTLGTGPFSTQWLRVCAALCEAKAHLEEMPK
jgi:hypothetical protein